MHGYIRTYTREKAEPFSSGFSTEGSLISASAVPHCGALDTICVKDTTVIDHKGYRRPVAKDTTLLHQWPGGERQRLTCCHSQTLPVATRQTLHLFQNRNIGDTSERRGEVCDWLSRTLEYRLGLILTECGLSQALRYRFGLIWTQAPRYRLGLI